MNTDWGGKAEMNIGSAWNYSEILLTAKSERRVHAAAAAQEAAA